MSEVFIKLLKIGATNSLNLLSRSRRFFLQMDNFFWSTSYLEKKMEKNNCQKICHCLCFTRPDHINSFQVDLPSLYHLKTSENLVIFVMLSGG